MAAAGDTTLDTTPPGSARRRVWAHPDVTSHSLVVLTASRVYLAPLAGAPKAGLVAAIESGGDLDQLLGPLAVIVELTEVRRLKLDLLTNTLAVEYVKDGSSTSRLAAVFATPETADQCFAKLWRQLGDGYRLRPYKRDTWALARTPLVLLFGALIATAVLALVLSAIEDTAARAAPGPGEPGAPLTPLERLLGQLNWRAVCAAGGVVAGLSQVWLYRRLTQPPKALEVTRT